MQALWMVLGAFFFSAMAACVKFASAWFTSAELVFWRGVVGLPLLWLLARRQGIALATAYPWMHGWRSMVGVLSLGAWFYSLAGLPLATSMTLNYMSSVWIAAFVIGGALLAWNPQRQPGMPAQHGTLALTVIGGFAGVVLMLRPTIEREQVYAGAMGLLSGITAAFAYLQVMALGKMREPETRTVFYFTLGCVVAGGIGMLATGLSRWDWRGAPWLLPIGALAAAGQLCMTRAYGRGSTLVAASLQYCGIVFGALLGMVLFGDSITPEGWAGMALIVGSGIAATVLRARAIPQSPAEEHA